MVFIHGIHVGNKMVRLGEGASPSQSIHLFSKAFWFNSHVELSLTCVCFQVTKQRTQSLQVTLKSASFASCS